MTGENRMLVEFTLAREDVGAQGAADLYEGFAWARCGVLGRVECWGEDVGIRIRRWS